MEARLHRIAEVIGQLAALEFDAHAPVGLRGDLVEAFAAGVNFLGEELQASYSELEILVEERTGERTAATEELERRALHDVLTRLPNRALFFDRLDHRIAAASRREGRFAVLFIDLNNVKDVNDSLGHTVGDQLLVKTTRRIRGSLRAGDSAARLGGDEFLDILDSVPSAREAMDIATRLARDLRHTVALGTAEVEVAASVGAAMDSGTLTSTDAQVSAADSAMYVAKGQGGNSAFLHEG